MKTKRNRFQVNHRHTIRTKYVDCEYMDLGHNQMVRKLMAREIDAFRTHVNRMLDPLTREPAPIRLGVV